MTPNNYLGRISIRPNDSGFSAHCSVRAQGYRAAVTFNGEPAVGIVTADSAAGMIVRLKRNDAGEYEFDKDRGELVDEVCHGKVEIEFHPERML